MILAQLGCKNKTARSTQRRPARKAFLFLIFGFTLGFALAYLAPTLEAPSAKSLDTYSDIAGVLIALCALYFTYYQISETKNANRINQTPHLMISSWLHPSDYTFRTLIHNHGNGPALINSMAVLDDGELYNKYPGKNLREIIREKDPTGATVYVAGCDLNETIILAAGRELELASITYDPQLFTTDYNTFSEAVHSSIKNVEIHVEFETTFGETLPFSDKII